MIISFRAKKLIVDGKEGKYCCTRILYYKKKEYCFLTNAVYPQDQFWYDPVTQKKTELPEEITQSK